jgi:hypothetical protein
VWPACFQGIEHRRRLGSAPALAEISRITLMVAVTIPAATGVVVIAMAIRTEQAPSCLRRSVNRQNRHDRCLPGPGFGGR